MTCVLGACKHESLLLLVGRAQIQVVLVAEGGVHLHLVCKELLVRLSLIYARLLLRLLELQNCSICSLVNSLRSLVVPTNLLPMVGSSNNELSLLHAIVVVNIAARTTDMALVVMALLAISSI
jgi:hypothetical protein